MKTYQVVLVVKTGSDELRKKIVGAVKDMLKGFKVTKEEDLGSKALAYKIKHEQSGHFYELTIEGEQGLADFEKKMAENTDVLRHLVLRKN